MYKPNFLLLFDPYEQLTDECNMYLSSRPTSCHVKDFDNGHYLQSFQPDFFIFKMFKSITNLYLFMIPLLVLTAT